MCFQHDTRLLTHNINGNLSKCVFARFFGAIYSSIYHNPHERNPTEKLANMAGETQM